MTEPANGSRDELLRSAVDRFERPLLAYAQRVAPDADRARDAVQETFARLCDHPPADLNGHLTEWLYTVCRSRCLDQRRKEKRVTPMTQAQAESFISTSAADPARVTEQRDATSHVLRQLERLPANQQEVLRLKFQHGMCYREIAAITGLSETNVGFLIHTGLKTLRERLIETPNDRDA
jgi:RNA polymerase sigma-70 factor (ECF subfamily)